MPLESTMICLDNSDWMRNGDYPPNRLDAQTDAATLLVNHRTNDNHESTVGMLSTASSRNKGVEVLQAPTNDQVKLLASLAHLRPEGKTELTNALQIAQLALKHRINKAGGQRIILFVGSPVLEDTKALEKVGTKLKKNNVAVSVVMLGELEDNVAKMEAFVAKVNSNDNSHLVTVPAGVIPSDAIRTSPIMYDQMIQPGEGGEISGGGIFEEYGGIDPEQDPELAQIMRISIMEARAAAETAAVAAGGGDDVLGNSSEGASAPADGEDGDTESLTDEQAVALAARISLESPSDDAATGRDGDAVNADWAADGGDEELDEDAELARAIALSMAEEQSMPPTAPDAQASGAADRNLGMDLLAGVGLDANDPLIAAALAQLPPPAPKDGDEPASKKSKDDKEGGK